MKQAFILWTTAAVITFLTGYIQNRFSPYYPVSGSIAIDGHKVSYFLHKIAKANKDHSIFIRTDLENMKGVLKWKKNGENEKWVTDSLTYSNGALSTVILKQNALTKIAYEIVIEHNAKAFYLPDTSRQELLFLGSVPASISIHYFLTLFLALLLAVRSGLEALANRPRLRLYAIFALISFISCSLIFAPVKKAYEIGAIAKSVPPIGELFEIWLIAFVIIWILDLLLVSYSKKGRISTIVFAVLTVLIFLTQNFF